MPKARCPGCCKTFPNETRLLQHMNQPRGHCITSRLRLESPDMSDFEANDPTCEIPFSEADDDGDWIDLDLDTPGPDNDLAGEVENHHFVTEQYPGASTNYGRGTTFIDNFNADRFASERQYNPFYPFSSSIEWQFASWLANSGLSMSAVDQCLSLDTIKSLSLSFRTAKAHRKLIESLPSVPRWKYQPIKTESPTKHGLQLFFRDPIECLQHLIHSPSINGQIEFSPKKIYSTADRTQRIYTEWLTSDRAWELQDALPDGATLLGVILSSDKTHITQVGNRQAHPLLISLANISANVRRKGSSKAYLLLALLPVPKFIHRNKRLRGVLADRLFHQVISIVVNPLKKAAEVGRMMSDPLGNLKYSFTLLAAYIADTPEQRLVAGVTSNASAVTMATSEQFGDSIRRPLRTASKTRLRLTAVAKKTRGQNLTSYFQESRKRQLNGVSAPFWLDWPLAEPSSFLVPEILHQVFKFFWDHDRMWCSRMLGADELDFRFSLLQTCTGHRHFPDGIMTLKQTSMRLHREAQRYIVGIVAGGIPSQALTAIRALTDFRYRSQAPKFTDTDIAKVTLSLQEFHDNKAALMQAGARGSPDHWNIPKLEMMLAIPPSIPTMGTLGQWSADVTEHAHIDVIKNPARSGNNQNFEGQICRYLDRQEKCQLFTHATTTHDLNGDSDSDVPDDDGDPSKTRRIADYFERARALHCGEYPRAPRPYRTFTSSSATAFHLSSKPTKTSMTVDSAAELYELPDFRPAIADYLDRRDPSFIHTIGGRRQATSDCRLSFHRIQVWYKMCLQQYSSYDPSTLLPSQGLHASPATAKWPFGRYDNVIISSDGNKNWPRNGLHGHEVVQLRLIFRPISDSQSPPSNMFFAYVQRFTITSVDRCSGMHVLKRSLRSTGEHVGDIIPLFQIHSPVHLIPRFGEKADPRLTQQSSNELSPSFWLNKYWTKELFHSLDILG